MVDTHRMLPGFNRPVELPTVRTLEQLREAFERRETIVFKQIRIRFSGYSHDYILPCDPGLEITVHITNEILSCPLVLRWIDALLQECQSILSQWNASSLFNKELLEHYTPRPTPPTENDLHSIEVYYSNLRSWFLAIHDCFNTQVELQKEVHAKWNEDQLAIYKKDNAESYAFRVQKLQSLAKALGPYHLKEYQLEAILAYTLVDLPFRIPPFSQNDIIAKKALETYADQHKLSFQGAVRAFQMYCSL